MANWSSNNLIRERFRLKHLQNLTTENRKIVSQTLLQGIEAAALHCVLPKFLSFDVYDGIDLFSMANRQ
jgi:hypothetical protein